MLLLVLTRVIPLTVRQVNASRSLFRQAAALYEDAARRLSDPLVRPGTAASALCIRALIAAGQHATVLRSLAAHCRSRGQPPGVLASQWATASAAARLPGSGAQPASGLALPDAGVREGTYLDYQQQLQQQHAQQSDDTHPNRRFFAISALEGRLAAMTVPVDDLDVRLRSVMLHCV